MCRSGPIPWRAPQRCVAAPHTFLVLRTAASCLGVISVCLRVQSFNSLASLQQPVQGRGSGRGQDEMHILVVLDISDTP
jgi:hypothetical protein